MSDTIFEAPQSSANGSAAVSNVSASIKFRGDGKTLFKIWITNLLLTIITLGVYFPWGKARMRKYIYSSTYFGDYNFEFHGTGAQMFKGMLKFFAVVLAFITLMVGLLIMDMSILLIFLIMSAFSPVVLALFIHGGRRYRMSQTSYRGIRFGYRGKRNELMWLLIKGVLYSIITFGIYVPIFLNNFYKYMFDHIRYGNVECRFYGNGGDFWKIMFIGGILDAITFGIYNFWLKRNVFNFLYKNVSFEKDGRALGFEAHATAGKFFELLLVNWLIIVFTLGLGFPFAKVRSLRFMADNLTPYGDMDPDGIVQTEEQYVGALGEAADVDFFDFDLW